MEKINKSPIIEELKVLHSQGVELVDPIDLSGAIKGRHNLYNHLESMIKNGEKDVLIMTSIEGLKRKIEALKKPLAKAKEKGVRIKIVIPESPEAQEIAKDLKGVAEVKTSKEVKGRFVAIDGKNVTFMISDDAVVHPTYDSAIWINSDYLAGTVQQMFDKVWKELK